ncbi:MAG TPA: ABC transporter ATP-binding protein [Candidatus Paceibacterota bacterium]|nr:ABC transporter ATP-binding protein [Candidatus Paceibacterota bacterium]
MKAIDAINIVKTYSSGGTQNTVLKGITLAIEQGEFVAIMGRSGAGKSTLLYQLSLLDQPTSGDIVMDGISTRKLSESALTKIRLSKLGYVFQDYALVPELTALENAAIPLLMQGHSDSVAYAKARVALEAVGLEKRINNLPSKLSGGEQQRVSIARAVAHAPKILFADEPTANLDSETGRRVIDILQAFHERGQTIVMVTHEEEYGLLADRVIRLSDGMIESYR